MATATTTIYTYLHTLALHDALPIFGIELTTTMKSVDELERAGMLRRTPHADDRRANALDLTSKGRSWREKMLPRIAEQESTFLDSLSQGERTLLQELLLRLVTA